MPAASDEIVVNTGPLIALDACAQVELLRRLHPRVIVPQAVVTELTHVTQTAGVQPFDVPRWIELLPLRQPPLALLRAHLDDGEASVIALAIELGCRLVVIDERPRLAFLCCRCRTKRIAVRSEGETRNSHLEASCRCSGVRLVFDGVSGSWSQSWCGGVVREDGMSID